MVFFAAIAALFSGILPLIASEAAAQTRSLKLHFTHTGERAEITYKRNGRYVQSGLKQINHILRDFRRDEPTDMDPRLIDLLWEVYQASGSRGYINVVSGYRSPETNAMLRSNSSGVAKKSQHMLGKAIDFYFSDVPVKKVRELGMKFQVGGVGYYPRSGTPFVHLDVGSVRAWPRMSRQELVSLFPDGKTLHLPPDGTKLAGYDAALADYKRRVGASEIAVAGGGARGDDSGGGQRRNIFAMLFGNNGDEDEDATAIASAAPAQRSAPASASPAPARAPQQTQVAALPEARNVPIPVSRPVIGQVAAPSVASLAPVGPSAPPPGTSLATATLPANQAERPALPEPELAEPVADEPVQYADLSTLDVPLPSFRPDRSGIAVFTPEEAPAFEGRDVTDVLMADASGEQPEEEPVDSFQTAMLPTPSARAEVEALAAATTVASSDGESGILAPAEPQDAGQSTNEAAAEPAFEAEGENAPTPTVDDEPLVELAALTSRMAPNSAAPTASEGFQQHLRQSLADTPLKGGRPTADDAARLAAVALKPGHDDKHRLDERMISRWAIGRSRLSEVKNPVKSPRFVDRQLRASPDMVYTTGFSADTVQVADRFTGAALNFLRVTRFSDGE